MFRLAGHDCSIEAATSVWEFMKEYAVPMAALQSVGAKKLPVYKTIRRHALAELPEVMVLRISTKGGVTLREIATVCRLVEDGEELDYEEARVTVCVYFI